MKQAPIELQQKNHIVWLDVVRLIAMFTVVCCHCTDPFNFYPGTASNIDEIKFWGGGLRSSPASLRSTVCNDYGSFTLARTWRCLRVL